MSIKHILITEPKNPVLRQLAMKFSCKPDLHLICFDEGEGGDEGHQLQMLFAPEKGQLRFRECKEISVDEIWHTANSTDSIEECRKKTERVLLFARRQKAPVLNYVNASTVAALRAEPFPDGTPQRGNEEEKHLLNVAAIEQSGCKFRTYRLPLSPEGLFYPASGWVQFVQQLARFKNEIEDRVPGYFSAQPLHLCMREERTFDIARMDDILHAMEQISGDAIDGTNFHVRTQEPLLLKEWLCAVAQTAGMRLQIVARREQQNYVDHLFGLRIGKVLKDLECSAQFTAETAPESPSPEQVVFSIPPISTQDLVAASVPTRQNVTEEIGNWMSGFKRKQVSLPQEGVLDYYVGGEGQKTLVLLNAYGQSFRYWEKFIQAVSPQLRIILWVPRGNNGDTIGLNVASPQGVHAEDLEKVLRWEQIESCTLLAWCSGPKLALEYHRRYPNRVSSMVFVAASFKGLKQHQALETDYEKNLEPLLEAIEKYPETAHVVLEYLKGILLAQGKQAHSNDEIAAMSDHDLQQALSAVNVSLRELVLQPFHAANVVAYAKQMCEFWKHDFVAALDNARVSVLFVGGDCDRIASQAIAKVVAGMMPQAKYLEIKGGTHYIHYDQWDLLAEITGQIVNTGGRLEFSTPRANMIQFDREPIAARQS